MEFGAAYRTEGERKLPEGQRKGVKSSQKSKQKKKKQKKNHPNISPFSLNPACVIVGFPRPKPRFEFWPSRTAGKMINFLGGGGS